MSRGKRFRSGGCGFERALPNGSACALDLDVLHAVAHPVLQRLSCRQWVGTHGAFPYDGYAPSGRSEASYRSRVPFKVAVQLVLPKLRSRLRQPEVGTANVAVPKAAMHEHHRIPARQDQIRPSWQTPCMKPVSKARPPEEAAYPHLRVGVPAPDA